MRKYQYFLAILLIFSVTSCNYSNSRSEAIPNLIGSNEITPVSMTNYTRSEYKIFVSESEYKLAKLEPETGCYLGSYVLANGQIDYDMKKFDEAVGKNHAISVYNLRLGEDFPLKWILECAANKKTPYIIVRPANEYTVFDESALISTAREFAKISVPVFLDLYPNPQSYTSNHERYANFYRKASSIFSEYAPKVVKVISTDSKNVYDFDLYYPGDEYVDWVGIIMYQTLYVNGEVNLRNYMKDLDYFYGMYQREKPIIISQFAVSSYSTVDHRYASYDAGERLKEFYGLLKSDYTRIKAINYMDFNNIDRAPKTAERDNFSVTQDETMIAGYQEAISDEHFLAETYSKTGEEKIEKFRNYFPVYEDENYKYILQDVFTVEGLEIPDTEIVTIDGGVYHKADMRAKSSMLYFDDLKKQIIIKK